MLPTVRGLRTYHVTDECQHDFFAQGKVTTDTVFYNLQCRMSIYWSRLIRSLLL